MSDSLTSRQTIILKALIDEYIEIATPVGSENLEKKYDLGISPATIRNEMVLLTKIGFLKQPHTSAGRIPTPKAMKFYINQLMEEKAMSLTDEVKAKEEVWDVRGDWDNLMKEAVHALATRTGCLTVAISDEGKSWHSGYSYVFSYPEFADATLCAGLFTLLEETKKLRELFDRMTPGANVEVVFGEDLGWPGFASLSIVGSSFQIGNHNAAMGVIGPARVSYPRIIPILKYFTHLIQDVAKVD